MNEQPEPPCKPGPFAHLALRDTRTERERHITEFNEGQRRRGRKERWHDFHWEAAANDAER